MHDPAYHEQKQHGTVDFPVAYYYVDENHIQYNMPFHWHKEWELIRILQGDFLLHGDESEYAARAGDILLIRDGMLHGGTPVNCVYECLVFDLHGLFRDVNPVKKYLTPIYRNLQAPLVYYPDRYPDVYPIVEELMGAFSPDSPGTYKPEEKAVIRFPAAPELIVLGNISRLFSSILQHKLYTEQIKGTVDSPRKIMQLKPVLEYMKTHYASPLTLAELAQVAGMSPKYFCRFFHSLTHQTPIDYVNYYRIEQAAHFLNSTYMTVTAIGLECGFNDSSYFVKAFKKYKGMTPRQYRKANL